MWLYLRIRLRARFHFDSRREIASDLLDFGCLTSLGISIFSEGRCVLRSRLQTERHSCIQGLGLLRDIGAGEAVQRLAWNTNLLVYRVHRCKRYPYYL